MYTMYKIPTLSPDNHCTVHILDMYTIYVHKIPTHSPDIHCKVHIYIYVHHVQDPNPFYGYPLYSTYIKHVQNMCTPCKRSQPFLQISTVQYIYKNMCTIVYTIYKIPTLSLDIHCTLHTLNM